MINFAERLKAARKMKGWSLEDLSYHMGEERVSKQALSKYENGEMQPNEENLLQICQALGISVDYFYRKLNMNIGKVSFRKLDTYPVRMQETIIAQTQDFIERYIELEELLGIESKFNVKKYTGFKITSPSDVEKAAEYIRKEWKLGSDPLHNVVELLEDNHIKVFEVDQVPSFLGFSTPILKNNIAVIVLNKSKTVPLDRKRFTALHELGHIVMDLKHLSEAEQESYCHHFAGAMLIPKNKLIEEIGSEKRQKVLMKELGLIKKQYGIAISALLFRLSDCDIISKTYAFSVMREMRRRGEFEIEPMEYEYKGEEQANRFIQLLMRGIGMELISTSKAAALNNMKLAEFRKILK